MAAVTRVKARPVMPPGYERVAAGITNVTEKVTAGDLVVLGSTGWALDDGATSLGNKRGFAAQDYAKDQEGCSIITEGEMDGFSGLTPGAPLYPSTSVDGGLDTSSVEGFTGRIWAVTTTRIAFSL